MRFDAGRSCRSNLQSCKRRTSHVDKTAKYRHILPTCRCHRHKPSGYFKNIARQLSFDKGLLSDITGMGSVLDDKVAFDTT